MNLPDLIAGLQKSVSSGGMTSETVAKAIEELATLGYQYDYETFPKLENTDNFINDSAETPRNLAEALLWKLGKWKSYKKFAMQYSENNSQPTDSDVVFFAFAKHLKNANNPIYDQHAIRAMWAICGNLTADEKAKCKRLLMNTREEWKEAGSGSSAVDCYNIYVRHLNDMVKAGATKREIDLLLMPLGQALKKSTRNFHEFSALCSL